MPNGNGGSVVIDASLNSSAMESAINILVADVDYKMNKLAEKFDQSITKMENSMGRMKRTSKDTNVSQNTQEIQSVSHLGESYDKLVSSMQAAATQASKRWDVSAIQAYRMQMHELEAEMNRLWNLQLDAGKNEWMKIGAEIDATRTKIQQLRQEQEQIRSTQPTNRFEQAQLTQQYNQIGEQINNLINKEQQLSAEHSKLWYELAKDSPAAQQLKAVEQQYENVKQKIREMGAAMQSSESSTAQVSQQIQSQKQLGQSIEEIKQQTIAAEEKKREEIKKTGLAAQESIQQLMTRMADALASGNNGASIMGIKELDKAIRDMRNAYYDMGAEKESPLGRSLKRDLDFAEQLRAAVKKFNAQLIGMVDLDKLPVEMRSLTQLKSELKDLTSQYGLMTRKERESASGTELIEKFQRLSRSAQEVQNKLNRPLSLDKVLKLPTSTIDEIIYKMQQLSSYRLGINVDSKGGVKEIQEVNAELDRLEQRKKKLLGQNEQVKKSNDALTRSFNYMKNRLAFYFTVGASTQFVKNLIEIRAQYELLEKSIGILVGSMSEGSRIFAELNAMAIQSPFTTMELGKAAKQLSAYDVAANEVVNTTKRLADMAAAVGVPIERLTYALGQVKAYDYLNARDARMFASAGIPLVKELAQYYTELEGRMVSTADVYARMKKHMISYNDTMAVVNKMTDEGGKFFNYQYKMAGTLKVQLANLTLAWNNMLNSIGKDNQSVITFPIKALKTLFKEWNNISSALKTVAIGFGVVKALQIAYIASATKATTATAIATATNWKFVDSLVAMRAGFFKLISSPITWFTLLAATVVSILYTFEEANEAIEQFHKSIRDSAKENVENITKFLNDYKKIRESVNGTSDTSDSIQQKPVSNEELTKSWDAIREEIELTSGAGDIFLAQLRAIPDINERVRASFNYLDTIKAVSAAIEKMSDDTIKIQQDYSKLWNLWLAPDSLHENVREYTEELHKLELASNDAKRESLDFSERFKIWWEGGLADAEGETERVNAMLNGVRENILKTSNSIREFAAEKNWGSSPDYINELYGQIGKKIIQDGLESHDWQPQDVFNFQLEWEEFRSRAAKEATQNRLADEKEQFKNTEDEKTRIAIKAQIDRDQAQLDSWDKNNGRGRVLWNEFTEWMQNTQSKKVQEMYNKMTENGKKAIDFQSAEWIEFVGDMTQRFSKEHKLSIDDVFNHLGKWVQDANKWKIFIELIVGTGDEDRIYNSLTQADKDADTAYNKVKRLGDEIDRLKEKKKKADAVEGSFIDKDIADTTAAQTKAQEDYNDALERGGKSRSAEADAKKKLAAANKANAASRREAAKAERKAESELQKAFKDELQILDKAQKAYSDLSKAGMARQDALAFSTKGYEESIQHINEVFKKWGIQAFDLSKYAGVSNPREILNMLESQLNTVIAKAKPEEIKELEVKIKDIRLEAEKFDMKKITDGLNNELGKLKEEYELAVELDANPELGGVFADMMGISQDELKNLPRDYGQLMDKLQSVIDQKLGYGVFDLSENLNKEAFTQWIEERGNELDDGFAKALDNIREYANKARLDETKKITQEWDKLLEKYSEYEYKRAQIAQEAEREREIARKHGADQTILNAINKKEQRRYAELDFNEFQKTSEWILATSDLSNLAGSAIQMLIDRINEYKRTAKNLEPKEILKMNNALRKLKREQMKKNPFKILSLAALDAQENMEQIQAEIDDVQSQIDSMGLSKKRKEGLVVSDEDKKKLEKLVQRLKYLRALKAEAGKIPLIKKVEQLEKYVDLFKQFGDAFKSFADSTNSHEMKQVAKAVSDVVDVISGALQGAATTGSWWGAIIGGVTTALPKILDWASGNAEINEQVSQSQVNIKKLTNFYKELEHAANQAYGAEAYGAQKTLIINKQLQLEELKRQLRLEKSRKKKYQDQSTIADLEGQIIDLKNEINDATNDIINGLLGITSKADFAEDLVKSMIDAFKAGEDYMKVFEDSFEEMIDNMIMKAIVSRLVGDWINSIWDRLDQKVAQSDRVKSAEADLRHAEDMLQGYEDLANESPTYTNLQLRDMWRKKYEEALAAYNAAITPTPEDIAGMREFFEQGRDDFKNNFLAYMDAFGIQFGESAGKADLSALQQGIQGITEDTAGALEAYMNSVSQQVYLHSDLLTQIRDILINFGGDVTIATNAQILLQLQQSFQVQMTIQNVLTGVLNASGLAFRVELAN